MNQYSIITLLLLIICGLEICLGKKAQCHVRGCCMGTPYDFREYINEDECIEFCRSKERCTWYTYSTVTYKCFTYRDCGSITTYHCDSAYSGQLQCALKSECDIQGRCDGNVYDEYDSGTQYNCHNSCIKDPKCQWFNYNNGTCQHLQSNEQIDESFNNWICSKKECPLTRPDCPVGFQLFEDKCYSFLHIEKENWINARMRCRYEKGDLAIVQSKSLNDYLTKQLEVKGIEMAFLGGFDIDKEDDWKWIDGTSFGKYVNWAENQPDNNQTHWAGEDCLTIKDGKWYDSQCRIPKDYICQVPKIKYT